MLKPELYCIIKEHKHDYIEYKFDALVAKHGHLFLRLPPYHPDLNPIEFIWATVKGNITKHNVKDFKLEKLAEITKEEFGKIGAADWASRCRHVVGIENNYLKQDETEDLSTYSFEEVLVDDYTSDSSVSDSSVSD